MLDFLIHLWFATREGETMTIDFNTINDFLFSARYVTERTELEKARQTASQLAHSIYWLQYEAGKEKNDQIKSDMLKEITAAERELVRINKNIQTLETINE